MKARVSFLIVLSCLPMTAAYAGKFGGPYVAVGGGLSLVSAVGGEFKEQSIAYKAIVGYQFGDYLALEGSYFSAENHTFTEDPLTLQAGLKGYNGSVLLRAPKGGSFAFYFKAGYTMYDYELNAELSGTPVALGKDSAGGVSYGAGINYVLRNGLLLRLELEGIGIGHINFVVPTGGANLDFGDVDFSMLSLAVGYKF